MTRRPEACVGKGGREGEGEGAVHSALLGDTESQLYLAGGCKVQILFICQSACGPITFIVCFFIFREKYNTNYCCNRSQNYKKVFRQKETGKQRIRHKHKQRM